MRVYFVPGLFGSTLRGEILLTQRDIWLSPASLLLVGFSSLELDISGLGPSKRGRKLTPAEPLADYSGPVIAKLRAELEPLGHVVVPWGYDWRLAIERSAARLAAEIRRDVGLGDECVIIGHSQGGIVARVAYSILARAGDQDRVKRIVTLGTPHYGSYGAPLIFSQGFQEFDFVDKLNVILIAAYLAPGMPLRPKEILSKDEIVAIMATWPSLYQLFPDTASPDALHDADRAKLYDPSSWRKEVGITDLNLQLGQSFNSLLAEPSTLPPPGRMTCIYSTGYSTVYAMTDISTVRTNVGWISTDIGDGVVTRVSAALDGYPSFDAKVLHRSMPQAAADNGTLTAEVLAERPDFPPPPVNTTVAPPTVPARGGDPPLSPPTFSSRYGLCPKGDLVG